MNGPKVGAGVRAVARAPGSTEATDTQTPPPLSDTGVCLTSNTSLHWLAGSFDQPFEEIADLVHDLTDGADFFRMPYGGNGYKTVYLTVGGLRIYTDAGAANMPPVHVSVPGQACEYLGVGKLRILFCNAVSLSRVDIAFDGYEETPETIGAWIKAGDVRTKVKRRSCNLTLNLDDGGNFLHMGAISSTWSLCAYDRRGFTRLELRLKKERASRFQSILLGDEEKLPQIAVGLLREFVDFVDKQEESNISRAPLKASWAAFTMGLKRVKMSLQGRPKLTAEQVVKWIEHQVAATLATYKKLGYSLETLIEIGQRRMRKRHLAILAVSGAG